MTSSLYPYARPLEGLELQVKGCPGIDASRLAIDLVASHEIREPDLQLEAVIPLALNRELRDGEFSALSVTAVAHCQQTDLRKALPLRRSVADPSIWTGEMPFDLDQARGEVKLRAVLSGTVGGIGPRLLAESPHWTIALDESARLPLGGELPVKWIDFSTRTDLQPFNSELFFVDLNAEPPVLCLNSHIDGLHRVLPREGQPSQVELRPMYETLRTSIARSVWLALFQTSMSAIAAMEDDADSDPAWPQTSWQQTVLRRILRGVFPDSSEADLLRWAVLARRSDQDARQLMERAVLVIEHDMIRDGAAIYRALRALDQAEVS